MAKIDDSIKKKVPELRFKGFTDDWELRKLSTEFEKVNERNDGSLGREHWISVAKMYFQSPEKVQSNNIDTRTYVMRIGDIAFEGHPNKDFKFGRFVANDIGTGVVSELFPIYRHKQDYNNYYWKNAIQIERIMGPIFSKSITSSGNSSNKLDPNHFLRQQIFIPKLEEQNKLGPFFKQLDNTITLHQRRLDLLKEQKKGYLQKMFPKNGDKVPELRFAGFADDWEDRKLSSIAERVTRKNKNNESTLPLTISAQDGLVDQNDYFNKQVASRDVTGYFLVKNGEFAYNKSYSNGYPWGAIKRLDEYEMGVLSTLYIVFKPTAINSQFLVSYYETTRWYREVSKNAAEGARNHGLLNISPNDFFNTLLTIPKSAEEQQQIGSFFKQLDDTIALHQRKLDLLREQKKGFLQKMFV